MQPQGRIQHERPALAGVACGAVANSLCTAGAQSGPRLACPLYVWKIMQVNDCGRETAPRASAGRARDSRSSPRSFTFRQILSSDGGVCPKRIAMDLCVEERADQMV